jgi:ABC-type uncharacterized transport system permease subunit
LIGLDAGCYPAMVYPVWLRLVSTFVAPIAVETTVLVQTLRVICRRGRWWGA